MTRREVLRRAAMLSAAAVASRLAFGSRTKLAMAAPPPASDDGIAWDKAPCRFCGTGCHVQVGTRGGRVVAIQGDQKAEVNKGLLCVKGYHVGLALYGADRLRQPLLRKNGKLEPITWAEAVDVIAKRIMASNGKRNGRSRRNSSHTPGPARCSHEPLANLDSSACSAD